MVGGEGGLAKWFLPPIESPKKRSTAVKEVMEESFVGEWSDGDDEMGEAEVSAIVMLMHEVYTVNFQGVKFPNFML